MILKAQEISDIIVNALKKAGVSDEVAILVADVALQADLRGVSSHGIKMVPTYVSRIKCGGINPNAKAAITQTSESMYIIDGNGGFGQVAAKAAQDIVIKGIEDRKIVCVGIKNSNHCGMLAYYTENICRNYAVGFMTSNTNPNVSPFGGMESIIGTNPFSVAFPGGKNNIIIDMATSAIAKGKIYEYQLDNKPIPEGWALNSSGEATNDADEALKGILLPFGGHKGYAISIIVELLSGVITGSGFLRGVNSLHGDLSLHQNVGMFMSGIPLFSLLEKSDYETRLNQFVSTIKNSKKAPGCSEIFIPGEIEESRRNANMINGIEIEEKILQLLRAG